MSVAARPGIELPEEVPVRPRPPGQLDSLDGGGASRRLKRLWREVHRAHPDRTYWNINSTPTGGGVAEMLHSMLGYARGLGADARWLVIKGSPEFFELTKRLHNALHGWADGCDFGADDRTLYETTLAKNAAVLRAAVRPGDIVFLHDPQTAGLAGPLASAGTHVIWRSHIGTDEPNPRTEAAWQFLIPYLTQAKAFVFSRRSYVRPELRSRSCQVIPPSIHPFAVKNIELPPHSVSGILGAAGLLRGCKGDPHDFPREDGSIGVVRREARLVTMGTLPSPDDQLVVQVSRWDRLKDPVGVIAGFRQLLEQRASARLPYLILAGPEVDSVADDPEGLEVFEEARAAWAALPTAYRQQVHLACLPTDDAEENAAIVNALQRQATIVVQKSLEEGFGLTVSEAMWKARPVVASAVGGIRDQIDSGVHGLLLSHPSDLRAFAGALQRLLSDEPLARKLGTNARKRVIDRFTHIRHLEDYGRLLWRLDGSRAVSTSDEASLSERHAK
jgi:trehalose synthase